METAIHSTLIKQFVNNGFIKTNNLNDKITEKDLLQIYQEWSKTMINPQAFHKQLQENHQVSFTTKRYYICLRLDYDKLQTIDTEKEKQLILKQPCNFIDELREFIKQIAEGSGQECIKIFSSQLYIDFVKQTGHTHLTRTKFGLNVIKIEGVTRKIVSKGSFILIN